MRFNPPPGWPSVPPWWTPPPGWQPDPDLPPPPKGWQLWLPDDESGQPDETRWLGLSDHPPPAPIGSVRARSAPGWIRSRRVWLGISSSALLVVLGATIGVSGVLTRAPVTTTPTSNPSAAPPAPASPAAPTASEPPQRPEPEEGTALYALAGLSVKGRAPKTGYDRDLFGSGWTDADNNGCPTREDILRRDLRPVTVLAGTGGCHVVEGTLADPYTASTLAYTDNPATSDDVEIDHIVPLSDAWQKGAQQWSPSKRITFANDPLELLATEGAVNAAKGDGDTATWLPPHKPYRCTYVARQISIKAAYELWVTPAEKAAMERVLLTCSDQVIITVSEADTPRDPSARVRTPEPVPKPDPVPDPEPAPSTDNPGGSVYYPDCTAVRAAGADPLRAGDPGYSRELDRDGDGVACE